MSIYLGNLSIDEMEKRSGVDFPQELKEFMNPRKQEGASKRSEQPVARTAHHARKVSLEEDR